MMSRLVIEYAWCKKSLSSEWHLRGVQHWTKNLMHVLETFSVLPPFHNNIENVEKCLLKFLNAKPYYFSIRYDRRISFDHLCQRSPIEKFSREKFESTDQVVEKLQFNLWKFHSLLATTIINSSIEILISFRRANNFSIPEFNWPCTECLTLPWSFEYEVTWRRHNLESNSRHTVAFELLQRIIVLRTKLHTASRFLYSVRKSTNNQTQNVRNAMKK